MHNYNESERMFAYIQKIDKYEEDNYGQIYFNKFSSYQFVEVINIDRCVGFFKIDNLFYILDRKRI
jgi:transcriptional antiterminator